MLSINTYQDRIKQDICYIDYFQRLYKKEFLFHTFLEDNRHIF